MVASEATETARASGDTVPRAVHNASIRATTSPGLEAGVRPKKSLIWLETMMTAMPAVKPVTTGSGIYLMKVPRRANPAITSMHPAISVASTSPS